MTHRHFHRPSGIAGDPQHQHDHAQAGRGRQKARPAGFVPRLAAEIVSGDLRASLPEKAQEYFVQGYNYALQEYGDEARAHHLGWAAVHRHYEVVDGRWHAKPPPGIEMTVESSHGVSGQSAVERLRRLHRR
jgi:cation transport regulator ChaB